ncbi:AlpA family phage regulatory protein [Sinorhizobium sp. M4_45]|uniref:helix-turn-helix transcriptional regulator n=1 Tax=Sinorhizobium sp. M4_45 TaxID=2037901 RepID=UPI000C9A5B6B|nr:AlpA family phage regulatory protein [Sinorhizobium sp. M4_45]PND26790.1 hypothetical protein CN933_13670 [Sinorhizobium sp. M4_45]
MEKVLEKEEDRRRKAATLGFESELAKLRSEVADLKTNRPTGPPSDAPVLISLNDVCRLTSLSRTAVNRWRALGLFPAAVPLGDKRVAFVRSEVEAWIQARIGERDRRKAAGGVS